MKDRGLFAGQLEAQRKAQQKGTTANLRRSMAAAGASPQEIARADAEASKGGAQQGRADALQASMSAMQSGRQGLQQAAGFTGQQAALAGQQAALGMQGAGMQGQLAGQAAGMAGQAQNLGLQKTHAQAGMYGQNLAAQQGLMNMGAGLAGQRAQMLQGEIAQQQGLTSSMSGMTDAQMQDIVARQNMAQERDLAERGLTVQQQANAANRPKGPSQGEQLMNLVKTGASVKMAFGCIPEGTTIDLTDGGIAVEDLKVGMKIKGWHGGETEILQVHQYKEDPAPHRFYHIEFDNGGAVDVSALHRIYGKRAKDFKVGDKVQSHKITSITKYNGVKVSYDLLTRDVGYRIGGIPVDSMIGEMAEAIADLNKIAA